SRPFVRARLAAELDVNAIAPHTVGEITMYALRHSSIVRQIMQGVPLRVVAALHDTSVPMIERNYSRHIAGQSDAVVRAALPSIQVVVQAPLPKAAKTRRPGREGQCPSGHSYQTYPPYVNAAGSVVCAECARIRTARNKAAKRMLPTTGEHP
ncbi:MAG: hypothetical protein J0626_04420, partial [Rhodospirillaceae bacterium]|nr:hypothetical protein [Rhodospirillaceae bacterium]